MGFFTDTDPGFRRDIATPAPLPRETVDPVGAAFRQSNVVASMWNGMANSGTFTPDPSHNPLDVIRNTPYEQRHLNNFVASRSEAETRAIMRRIDGEEQDQRTLEAAGAGGFLLSMIAGTVDPTILLPGSIAIRAGKAGYEFSRAAVNVGAAGALQMAAQESILQASQETRTLGESVINVGSGTLLAGLLGGAAARLLSPVERAALVRSLDTARADIEAHANPRPAAAPSPTPTFVAGRDYDPSTIVSRLGEIQPDGIVGFRAQHGYVRLRDGSEIPVSQGAGVIWGPGRSMIDPNIVTAFRYSAGEWVPTKTPGAAPVSAPPLAPITPSSVVAPVGAAATDTRVLDLMPSIPGTAKISTTRRVLEAESTVARRALADTAETPYSYRQSREGVAATQGPTVDRIVKMAKDGERYAIGQELDRLFTEYRFGDAPPAMARMRAGIDDALGRTEGKMSYGDFKKQVAEAMMFGDQHAIPQVAAAAQFIRQKIEPWTVRAENAIEGFERLTPAAGESYFPHNWNKEKIKARRPEFTDRLTELYRADQATKAAAKDRLIPLNRDLQALTDAIEKAKTPERKATLELERNRLRAKIEEEVAAWQGKSVSEAKAAMKAREKYAAETERPEGADPLHSADKAIDRAVKHIIESDRDLSVQELRSVAQQTVDRILGSPDGRLPYDVFRGDRTGSGPGEQQRGSLARRQLNVTNAWARQWIEDDIEHVVNSHLRTVVPDVVIAEKFGDVEMAAVMRAVQEDYARLADAARGNEKKQTKLGAERDAVIRDLAAIRDRIRGVYGYEPGTANLARVATAVKQVNNITSMGMSAIASISDFAGAPLRYGIATAFRDGWAPFFKAMVSKSEGWEKHKAQWRALGIGVDTAMNLRQHAMDDIVDGYRPQSRVERVLQWTNDKFFIANMLAPLTDVQKQIATSVASAEALRGVRAITEGKATRIQIQDLADAGIDAAMAGRIHRQAFELGHAAKVDGVHLPNTADWTDQGARLAFEGAIARAADIAVVTPGQEKPLLMSKPVGSLLMQFKAFPAAATERILISNLQRRDAKALQGVMVALSLGMLSYKINSMLGGQEVSSRPQDWIKEGISRSGLIGWFEEGNAMAAKATRGTLDVHRLYGADKPLSRYASRSLADAFLGPTAGKLSQIGQIGGAAATGEWTEGDTRALRRLMFFQNMFWLRGAINQVEAAANHAFNVPEKAPDKKPN